MSKSLDLGCGDKPRNPFHADEIYGVDVRAGLDGRIRRADLVVDPIPFADGSFDYVTAHDFIEHLPRIIYAPERRHPFVEVMNEVHRVLKPGGLFFSYTPAYPHVEAFRDPTHVNIITFDTFPEYFADPAPHAVIYGFKGAFELGMNTWHGKHVTTVLRKIESPRQPARAAPHGTRVSVALDACEPSAAAATLESLLAQSHADVEIVVLRSEPAHGATTREDDRRVRRPHEAQHAVSLPHALNLALPTMNGDYFVLARAGERYAPDWLERQVRAAREQRAEAVIAAHEAAFAEAGRGAWLTGREVCKRLGTEAGIDQALCSMELVRSIGFEQFASDAHRYSTRRVLLACARVALVHSAPVGAAAPRAEVDAPYTELRLAQLYREQGLPASHVQAQMRRARAALADLRQAGPAGTAIDDDAVQRCVDRCRSRLALRQVFDPPAAATPRERLRTIKRGLRERAENIRLAFADR